MAKGGKQPGAGRPKGKLAKSTLAALEVKTLYVEKAKEFALPMLIALVKRGLEGDVSAIKEFNDRVFGKSPQAITGAGGGALQLVFDSIFNATTHKPETDSK